jgi:hypothetical protein
MLMMVGGGGGGGFDDGFLEGETEFSCHMS